jgi:N-acetylglutamate synthase-like GNAT family acetyltransferase
VISPASVADAPRAAALLRATFEDGLNTIAGIRYRMTSALPEDRMGYWKAEHDGELIGWAYAGLNTFAPTRTAGFGGIVVGSSDRRKGVGAALWDAVSAHIDEIGVRRLVANSQADDDSMSFPRARGFALAATQTSLAVDPRTIVRPTSLPPGVELRPFSAYADDPKLVYEADRESILDEPGPGDFSGITYETWRRHHWGHPDCDLELGLVALVDGQIVGTTFLMSDREGGRALNGGTGVVGAFRGRGLGLLMKQGSLAAAANAGIVRVFTQNDDSNAPMIAINKRLGYKPFSSGHSWVLEI